MRKSVSNKHTSKKRQDWQKSSHKQVLARVYKDRTIENK